MSLCKKIFAIRSALTTPLGLHIFNTHHICIHTHTLQYQWTRTDENSTVTFYLLRTFLHHHIRALSFVLDVQVQYVYAYFEGV